MKTDIARTFAALNATNEAILYAKSPEELYTKVCEASFSVGDFLAVAVFLIFVDTANTMVLYSGDNLRPVAWLSLVTMSANILFCLVLIPRFAERGAAVATILSTALSIAIFTPVVLRSLRQHAVLSPES